MLSIYNKICYDVMSKGGDEATEQKQQYKIAFLPEVYKTGKQPEHTICFAYFEFHYNMVSNYISTSKR